MEGHDQQKRYIDRDIFADWLTDPFRLEIAIKREKDKYASLALLIRDNYAMHAREAFGEMSAER
jgi:hypothetical protein